MLIVQIIEAKFKQFLNDCSTRGAHTFHSSNEAEITTLSGFLKGRQNALR